MTTTDFCNEPETFQPGDIVTAELLHGTFEGLEIVKVLPRARRFKLKGHFGRFTNSGDERLETVEAHFDQVELERRAS